jgi:hypothetical protein
VAAEIRRRRKTEFVVDRAEPAALGEEVGVVALRRRVGQC